MKISYSRLFEKLKMENIKQKDFKEQANISSATMNKLLHNENVTTEILCRICDYFQCMPDEIMEWIPNENYEQIQKEKQETLDQIAKLQEKLKQIGG